MTISTICLIVLIAAFILDLGATYAYKLKPLLDRGLPIISYLNSAAFLMPLALWGITFVIYAACVIFIK